jgi:outer membrane protein assembly factor BamB
MKSPICVTNIRVANRKQTASFSTAGLILAIAPLWLMLATANTSANAQTSDNVSNASATTTPAPSPADWTEFLRDNMQRWNPYETVLGVGNVGGLELKWANPIGGSVAAVANGVVYVGSGNNVYALNASTGALLWSYTTGFFVVSSPAVANGVVYVGSLDKHFYALNASTGALLWSYAAGGLLYPSPAVANGVVYVGGCSVTNLCALNASTGALLWSFATGQMLFSSPAVANGVVYINAEQGNLSALNASTGTLLWSYNAGGSMFSSPVVANGVVYVASDGNGNIYALNASTGALLWSYFTGFPVVSSTPAVANGVVYISSADGNFFALNASTGALLWSFAADGSPAVANGVVYVGSHTDNGVDYAGNLYALNASTGALLWSSTAANGTPAVVNGTLYVGSSAFSLGADLYLRIFPTPTTVHQGDLITYAFPVWNLGPGNAVHEVLNTQVPEGTTLDYVRISGTPGLGTCTTPPYEGTGEIVCHENSAMAPNTTWTVRVVVKVTAPSGTVITESATTTEETPDPNLANNTATVSLTVQ